MLIKNIYIENAHKLLIYVLQTEYLQKLQATLLLAPVKKRSIPAVNWFCPPLLGHVHLDTCLTADDPVWNMSDTLFEGIECWSKRKEKLTHADVKERANRALHTQALNSLSW